MTPISPKLPAGLTDSDVEIFTSNGQLLYTQHGQVNSIDKLSPRIRNSLRREMLSNKATMTAMKRLNIPASEMLSRYITCNYGGFDFTPDSNRSGSRRSAEVWDCGCRATCSFYGKICKAIFTVRENMVLKEISTGDPDKWIAPRLGISLGTLSVHKRNISRKKNLRSKAEMTRFVLTSGL